MTNAGNLPSFGSTAAFAANPGETEDDLCKRGRVETGNAESDLILVQWVRAVDGRPAPGFERFAK